MATSSIPTLKANLVTQLSARGGLSGVQVSYGPPAPVQDEYIWLGDTDGAQEYATYASPNQRHEAYQLQVVICKEMQGTGMQAADERCFALFAEVEAQLRTDPTVNSAVSEAHVGAYKLSEILSPDGMNRIAQLEVQVNCQAWI